MKKARVSRQNCSADAKAAKYGNVSPLDRSLIELWDNEYDEIWNKC